MIRRLALVWLVVSAVATLPAQQKHGAPAVPQQAIAPPPRLPAVTSKDLLDGLKNPGRWLTYSGDYTGQRHSPLTQITPPTQPRLSPPGTSPAPGPQRGRGRPAPQPPHAHHPRQRVAPLVAVDVPGRGHAGGARFRGDAADDGRGPLHHRQQQPCLGDRCADRPADLALSPAAAAGTDVWRRQPVQPGV